MASDEKHCSLCGMPVKVVGRTTMHYEPDIDQAIRDRMPSYVDMENKHGMDPYIDPKLKTTEFDVGAWKTYRWLRSQLLKEGDK